MLEVLALSLGNPSIPRVRRCRAAAIGAVEAAVALKSKLSRDDVEGAVAYVKNMGGADLGTVISVRLAVAGFWSCCCSNVHGAVT